MGLAKDTLISSGVETLPSNDPMVETLLRRHTNGTVYSIAINHGTSKDVLSPIDATVLKPFEIQIKARYA